MVVSINDIESAKTTRLKQRLQEAERTIDSELKFSAERLSRGLEVMVPLQMPIDFYEPLLDQYREKGWIIRHEKINVFGRLYFSKKL